MDTPQLLHVYLTDSALFARLFFFTFVYAACEQVEMYPLWDSLRQITSSMEDSPWLVGGYFNIFLHYYQHSGSSTDWHQEMVYFADAIADCQLSNVGYSAFDFTWKGHHLLERLDHVLLNESWSSNFAASQISMIWAAPTVSMVFSTFNSSLTMSSTTLNDGTRMSLETSLISSGCQRRRSLFVRPPMTLTHLPSIVPSSIILLQSILFELRWRRITGERRLPFIGLLKASKILAFSKDR
ncbi:hypothetical protein C2S53_019799 [Perilla frutescens var. hirtella]|uniref:Uncharacterized protein n=1 Tax=Perilla frutescens var. hirtella TaxID=608512 RepID=A0AAD4P5I6_PERFH|nr:hypothetical protein C2S53_019799 [Perilla frutescens var. hirtella]